MVHRLVSFPLLKVPCLALAALLAAAPPARAITAAPDAVELKQPDGRAVRLHVRGDEFSHWFEDEQGFSVVRDAAARYVYANRDAAGRLGPTALVAGRDHPGAAGLARGLQPTPEILAAERVPGPQRAPGDLEAAPGGSPPQRVQPQGTVKNLVVLCKFADHVTGTHTRPQADYDVLFNTVGGNPGIAPTGSVRDYFTETSYGTMTLQSTVLAWVTLPQNEAYYADGKDGTDGVYPKNAQGMVRDALNLADGLVDFGDFDQDNDGYVDCLSIIHSGYGAETGGGNGNWIWSHRWSLFSLPGGQWTSGDNNGTGTAVKVYDYHTEPALWGTSGTGITRIGVICHETGHFFGLPDLYDSDSSSSGIGAWCLMANSWGFDGTQLRPPHLSAWCKEQLGWLTPTVITAGTQTAQRVETSPSAFKITSGFPAGEYLLVENRQAFGFEPNLPGGGLAIWHIDTPESSNSDEGYPGQAGWPTNGRHFKIALLQADGRYDLEKGTNDGDSGDLYRSGGVSAITPATVPSTDRYQGGIVATTNHSITNISASGNTMTFNLNVVSSLPVITSAASATGSPGTPFSYQIAATNGPTSYSASGLPANLVINTSTGLISGTPAAAGTSTVTLSATNGFGTGTATLTLSIVSVITPATALDTTGLTWTAGGNSPWTGQTATTHDAVDAAQSGASGHNQESWIETTVTGSGTLTFWWKVSSESGYDFLRFTLDGAEVASAAAISGSVDWVQKTVSIGGTGPHTLRWRYVKDDSVQAGSDAAWLDQVVFTAGTAAPVINSVTAATAVLGQPFNYQITASNTPTGFSASGLPANLAINTATGLISGTPAVAGNFNITLGASNAGGTGNATLALAISSGSLTLPEAVDAAALPWTSGGTAGWTAQSTVSHDASDAAQSGLVSHSQESWLETTISGAGTLTFWWKVSSESGYDFLSLLVNGAAAPAAPGISGNVDWQLRTVSLPAGTHILRWVYAKDSTVSSGSDAAWLDQVHFAPSAPTSIERVFTSTGGVVIPDSGNAAPYPSTINVSGVTGTITALRVRFDGLSHSYPDDIDAFLVGPGGQTCALMSDAGDEFVLNAVNLVFSDSAVFNMAKITDQIRKG